jgi:hypothetical protein
MSYRHKTSVIVDCDNDLWPNADMKVWNEREHTEFDSRNQGCNTTFQIEACHKGMDRKDLTS